MHGPGARGIPALWFKLPYYEERVCPAAREPWPPTRGFSPRPWPRASRTAADARRACLAARSQSAADRQVMGVSLGGILAGTAAGQEPRMAGPSLFLAGGDLLPVVHHARESRLLRETIHRLPPAQRAEVEQTIVHADPLQHAAGLRERALQGRVLMINAGKIKSFPGPAPRNSPPPWESRIA